MILKKYILFFISTVVVADVVAQQQNANRFIELGNGAYRRGHFDSAVSFYNQAIEKKDTSQVANYNLGNSMVRNNKFAEAAKQYETVANATSNKTIKANSHYNQAVALAKNKQLQEAVEAYKNALRTNANDQQARENLQKLLQQMQQQKQQDKKDKEKEEPKKDKEEQKPKPQPSKLSKQQAERDLAALRQLEKNTNDKLNKRIPATNQPEKDW
jgi:Ca-activated chloride channel homolog